MGREAYFGGNMQAVAKLKSQEPFASRGGLHDWTEKGSLASETLESQIFSLPANEMSDIIEDAEGFHIIRVLERDEAGLTTLANVQDEIRAKIRQQKISDSQEAVMETMRDRVPVWSLYPQDIPGAKPLPTRSENAVLGSAALNPTPNDSTTTLR
jgi:parvulin-like peptidyl-prolyl isomerase